MHAATLVLSVLSSGRVNSLARVLANCPTSPARTAIIIFAAACTALSFQDVDIVLLCSGLLIEGCCCQQLPGAPVHHQEPHSLLLNPWSAGRSLILASLIVTTFAVLHLSVCHLLLKKKASSLFSIALVAKLSAAAFRSVGIQ